MDELGDGEGEEASGDVVEHDAGAGRDALELADGRRLEDIEETEEEEGDGGVLPVRADGDEGDELAGDFIDDDVPGVFTAGLAGDDRGGGYACSGGDDGGDEGAEGEGGGVGWRRWAVRNQRRTAATEP